VASAGELREAGRAFEPSTQRGGLSREGVLLLHAIWPTIYPVVQDEVSLKQRPFWLTGHGMGGTIATLAAKRLNLAVHDVQAVVSYGAPSIGDSSVERTFEVFL
jgi:hypothetical protein